MHERHTKTRALQRALAEDAPRKTELRRDLVNESRRDKDLQRT